MSEVDGSDNSTDAEKNTTPYKPRMCLINVKEIGHISPLSKIEMENIMEAQRDYARTLEVTVGDVKPNTLAAAMRNESVRDFMNNWIAEIKAQDPDSLAGYRLTDNSPPPVEFEVSFDFDKQIIASEHGQHPAPVIDRLKVSDGTEVKYACEHFNMPMREFIEKLKKDIKVSGLSIKIPPDIAEIDMLVTHANRDMVLEVIRIAKERDQWKANHDNQVKLGRVLRDRLDMPLERVRAYNHMVAQQAKINALEAELKSLRGGRDDG